VLGARNIGAPPDGQNLDAMLSASGGVDIPQHRAEFLYNPQIAGVLQVGFDDLERFDHKDVALREIVAHLLLGFCKDDVRGIQMPRIAAQPSKPAVEIGLVMRHEVRKSLHPIMRTMWIKDYRKEASESVILDEYIMIFHHSWPNSTGRSRAKREGPYLLTMCKSIFAACSRR
jgi:hypothetical protein